MQSSNVIYSFCLPIVSYFFKLGNGKITAAMIADIGIDNKNQDELRLLNYVKNFTSSVFEDVDLGYPIEFKYWPPIYSKVITCKCK